MTNAQAQKKRQDLREKAVKSALALAAAEGWNHVSLNKVARHAGIKLTVLHEYFSDRNDILAAYSQMVDRRVLDAVGESDEGASHRDRLFDILMERFDILNEDRTALLSILESIKYNPPQAALGLPGLGCSMSWMLEAAGIEASGLRGAAHVLGLTTVYLMTLKTWMEDDSPDMGKTMAALDKNLGRAEHLAGMLGFK